MSNMQQSKIQNVNNLKVPDNEEAENADNNGERIQPTKTDLQWTKRLELADKNIKMFIITAFYIYQNKSRDMKV